MYSEKVQNVKVSIDAGRYISINDPYQGGKSHLPGRWKEKQLTVPRQPENAGDGYFGYENKAFTYVSDAYQEQRPYLKTQPADKRKLGFGTHDASRRDEFSQTIRTEQYRETLKKETRSTPVGEPKKLAENTPKQFIHGKPEIKFLYDVGVNVHTEFDPKNGRERFYSIKHGQQQDKRMGGYRTASQDIGDGAWDSVYQKPEFSAPSQVKNFFDQSHLQVGDV